MSAFDEMHAQLNSYIEALDRVADKIAETTDKQVKTALIKQYDELKSLKAGMEVKIKDQEETKTNAG